MSLEINGGSKFERAKMLRKIVNLNVDAMCFTQIYRGGDRIT